MKQIVQGTLLRNRFWFVLTAGSVLLACGCQERNTMNLLARPAAGFRTAKAMAFYVAPGGVDSNPGTLERPFRTIQRGVDAAKMPGDAVYVRAGTYAGGITFPVDGTADQPIILANYPKERPFISGKASPAQQLIRISNRSHIRVSGFELGNLEATSPLNSGAVFVDGYGEDIRIQRNVVHDVTPKPHKYANGRAISVRGFLAGRALTNVVVSGNEIERCTVTDGNILEVSGNADDVTVSDNTMRDNVGTALSITGGTRPPAYSRWSLEVRNVQVDDNSITDTSGPAAIGLYVQASKNVEVLRNRVIRSKFGIYVDSEYPGVDSQDIHVNSNMIQDNSEAGLWLGTPFFRTTLMGASAIGNVVLRNGPGVGDANFGIGQARDITVERNQFASSDSDELAYFGAPYRNVKLDRNCYDDPSHQSAGARFSYAGTTYRGFSTYQAATHQDASSTFGPPCGAPSPHRTHVIRAATAS